MRLTRPSLPPQVKDDPIHVRIRDVHKTYGDHHVLNSVSLDIHRGKTNLIIGPSGSGKTVLMRQLIRLEKPDSGELLVNGVDFAKLESWKVDQSASLASSGEGASSSKNYFGD